MLKWETDKPHFIQNAKQNKINYLQMSEWTLPLFSCNIIFKYYFATEFYSIFFI